MSLTRTSAGLALAALAALGLAGTASAQVNQANQNNGSSATAFDGDIVSTDLINQNAATLASGPTGTLPGDTFGFSVGGLNDGTGSTSNTGRTYFEGSGEGNTSNFPITETFTLNTGTNTSGYTITQVRSIAGFGGPQQFADQSYQLLFSTVSAPTAFTSAGTFSYIPFVDATATSAASSSEMTLTGTSGAIAANVAAVRFVFLDSGQGENGLNGSGFGGTVYHEVDVLGTPTAAPEPSQSAAFALGVLGLAALVLRARRRGAVSE